MADGEQFEPESAASLDDAEERAVVRLVDIVYDATDEAAVIAWMAANKVQASTLTAKHASDESTALLLALRRKWPAAAKGIADVQRDFGDANSLGDTALHWACLRAGEDAGVLALAEQLLAAGADPNATGDLGNTPLHLAAAANCPLAIQLLLMHGAEPNHMNTFRQLPENVATSGECLALFAQLQRDGDLCRQELREQLQTQREKAARGAADRAAISAALERDRVTALQQAAERRKHEDAAADRAAADDVRRLHAEMARRERNEEERLRAAEEHMRSLEDAIKRNKKPKAAK